MRGIDIRGFVFFESRGGLWVGGLGSGEMGVGSWEGGVGRREAGGGGMGRGGGMCCFVGGFCGRDYVNLGSVRGLVEDVFYGGGDRLGAV